MARRCHLLQVACHWSTPKFLSAPHLYLTNNLTVTALAVACKSIQTSKLVLDIEMWKLMRSKYVSKVVLDCEN